MHIFSSSVLTDASLANINRIYFHKTDNHHEILAKQSLTPSELKNAYLLHTFKNAQDAERRIHASFKQQRDNFSHTYLFAAKFSTNVLHIKTR